MQGLNLENGLFLWMLLVMLHVVLSYIGARKMVRLDLPLHIRIIWLLAIFCIPFVGIATFFILFNTRRPLEMENEIP